MKYLIYNLNNFFVFIYLLKRTLIDYEIIENIGSLRQILIYR